jgi:NAD(P)-dependent dehydrogenase (short-subunit alcohol dehydrogenase family)
MLATQAIGGLPAGTPVRLLTVTRGAAEILGGDLTAPAQAAVHGLGRVAKYELADLDWRGVDIDAGQPGAASDAAQAARELAWELHQPPADYQTVAGWRRGRRWEQGWAQVVPPDNPEPPWRPDGVYLITGGTRGLGLALARHLVRSGVRRLALVGRTRLTASQDQVLDERTERARAAIAELEAAGAEVLPLTADAGEPEQLRAALRACREHFGALHGVVHAAGVPASGMIARHGMAEAMAVLAPKVLAMDPLAELVGPQVPEDQRPELLVLYSSAITALGGIGESDYCAANAVLDAYGAALAAVAPATRVVTVAWGPWRHDDWQAAALQGAGPAGDGLAARVRAHREKYGFADEEGCAFLDRLIATGPGSLLAVRQPMDESLREWSEILDISTLISGVEARPPAERFPRPRLRTEFVAPRTEREAMIADIWGSFLGIDQVGVHDPFFELGGNSLVGLAVVRAVEKKLSIAIPPATLFGNPTVAEFATAVEHPDGSTEAVLDLLNTSADRGRKRRGTRAGKRR